MRQSDFTENSLNGTVFTGHRNFFQASRIKNLLWFSHIYLLDCNLTNGVWQRNSFYEHVKHVPNLKPHGRYCWPSGRISKFCKFWRKKKEIEPFDVISENSSPEGFFWPNKKKNPLFRFCRPILDIFGLTLLNHWAGFHTVMVCSSSRIYKLLFNF